MKWRTIGIILAAVIVVTAGGIFLFARPHVKPNQTADPAPPSPYAALGDSVAAGIGLQPYSDPSACDRTDQSYPHQVAAGMHYRLYNLACSGATLEHGILGPQEVNDASVPAQLDQLFALPKPRAISLTIGANDIGWTNFLTSCYRATCGTAEDSAAVSDQLAGLRNNLYDFLTKLQGHYGNAAPAVIVTGYYQVVPTDPAACQDLSGVDANEQAWLRQQQNALNDTIRSAAANFSFARYVGVDFTGHELCSTSPWVQGLADPAPYHPTAAGQSAYARAVMAAIPPAGGQKK